MAKWHNGGRNGKELITLDQLLEDTADNPLKTKNRLLAPFQLILCVTVFAVVLSLSAMPYTLLTAGIIESSAKWWKNLPSSINDVTLAQRTIMVDENGKQFATIFSQNRVNVSIDDVSKNAINALVATEDSRFFEHSGMDPKGVVRAIVSNILKNDVQGASTITQQLVQNLRQELATNEEEYRDAQASSVHGKIAEVRYAQGIETDHSKEEILETYFNIVNFGNGAYGIEAASQRYFNVSAKDLTPPQAATLIAMLKSPTYYDPIAQPEASRQRRDVVLSRMRDEGYITAREYAEFIKESTPITGKAPRQGCAISAYPFYCQLVFEKFIADKELGETYEQRKLAWQKGGYKIDTPLDPKAMKSSQKAAMDALGVNNRVATSVVMMRPGTGEIIAIAQNRKWGKSKKKNFNKTEIVYANSESFQSGSTFKPITAAAALDRGLDPDLRLNAPNGAFYPNLDEPEGGFKNANRRGAGVIGIKEGFKYSVNTFFTSLISEVGVIETATMARRLGMRSIPQDLTGREGSLTLGAYETSPLQLATSYATFAGRGMACDPVVMNKVTRIWGNEEVVMSGGNCHQEISPAIADTISDKLQSPFESGGTAAKMKLNRKATGKTGTTNDSSATWFAGYTPQLVTAVWVGDPRGGSRYPLNNVHAYGRTHGSVFGGTIAGPIWKEVMEDYHKGLPKKWFPKPGGVSASVTTRVVPNVLGLDVDTAITILLESGFKVNILEETAAPKDNVTTKNIVMKMSPKSGRAAAYSDVIELKLSAGSDTSVIVPETLTELKRKKR